MLNGLIDSLVSRLSNKQRSKLKQVGCYDVFLADDFIGLVCFLAMCKDNPDTITSILSFTISPCITISVIKMSQQTE